ncbi:MAG: hypothetical protein KME01_14460 [Chroococcus sp. CMT-3BRIN-NPC107]|jgi:hypothetical protein|nr:hypothetical protein [Chroococcus sp. CMT-3BRIN-NPC107]
MKRLTEFGLFLCCLILVCGSLVLSLDNPNNAIAFLDLAKITLSGLIGYSVHPMVNPHE